ncbi:MAG: hypothetical protein FWF94_07290 [Oscillospiraceae bacterium]|nr:hypothetical protein [Oscillospiraceae bacterium]
MARKNDIIIDREELKSDIKMIFGEIITESFTNFGSKMTSALFGESESPCNSFTASKKSSRANSADYDGFGVDLTNELPEKSDLCKIVSGYLHMTLGEMRYTSKEIIPIIQRIEKKINDCDYKAAMDAYKKAENALSPICIRGIIIPREYFETKITDLKYSDYKLAARITKALKREGIIYIKDFQDNVHLSKNIQNVRSLGVTCIDEFLLALKRTITGVEDTKLLEKIEKPKIYEISGVVIPEHMLDKRIDKLNYVNSISKTKIVKKLKTYDIVCLRDFFKGDVPRLTAIFSQKGKNSFLDVLRRSL